MLEQERLMVPLQRELEQLRANTYSEGQFSETFRRMEDEKKELKSAIEMLEVKIHAYMDELTVSGVSL